MSSPKRAESAEPRSREVDQGTSENGAPLSVADANALFDLRIRALEAARTKQEDLEARVRADDQSVSSDDFVTEAEFRRLGLAIEAAFAKLEQAVEADSRERSEQLWVDCSSALPAKAKRVRDAYLAHNGTASNLAVATRDYLESHDDFARRAKALPGVAEDPERRNLPPHQERFFSFGQFAPKVSGTTFEGGWQAGPALVAIAIRFMYDQVQSGLVPKWKTPLKSLLGTAKRDAGKFLKLVGAQLEEWPEESPDPSFESISDAELGSPRPPSTIPRRVAQLPRNVAFVEMDQGPSDE